MKLWTIFSGGLLLVIGSLALPSAGRLSSAHELQMERAGAYTQCTHFGPKDGNCTDCSADKKTRCDVSRPNAQCIPYVNNGNCLACQIVSTKCPGHKLNYPNSDCPTGTPEMAGDCESNYDLLNVASCAEVIPDNPKFSCPGT
jgi:hypothetical protein